MTVLPTNRGPTIAKLLGVLFVRSLQIRSMILARASIGGISVPNMGNMGLFMLVLRFQPCFAFDGRDVLLRLNPGSHKWNSQHIVASAGVAYEFNEF